jgi:hypothetical protein
MDMDESILPQARHRRRKDLTADIDTIFTKDKRMCKDGTVKSGHWCDICKYMVPYPPTHPCALVSDPWPGKGNMAEMKMRGLQVQRVHFALTFGGIFPIPDVSWPCLLTHSKLLGSLIRITRRTQSSVQSLGSLRTPARSRRRALVKEEGMAWHARLI